MLRFNYIPTNKSTLQHSVEFCNMCNLVVCFLLGNSLASEFYIPMFRNTLSHLHRRVGTYLPMKIEQSECSKTLAYKIQTMGNYPEESTQHSEHGESLISRMCNLAACLKYQFNFPKVNSKILHTNSSQISLHYSDIIFQIPPPPLVKHSHKSFNSLPRSECDFIYEWLLMKTTKRTLIYSTCKMMVIAVMHKSVFHSLAVKAVR